MNKNIAVFGSAVGDESKARAIYEFSPDYSFIVRPSGSSNAGHTIYHNGKKIVRHLVPCVNFEHRTKAFLGSGMVINPEELLKEIKETNDMFPGSPNNIIIDPDAFIISQAHIEEDKEKNKHIGSTNKGVSPAYRDKVNRSGVRLKDLIKDNSEIINAISSTGATFKFASEMMAEFRNSNILFEGAQSIFLDLNFGQYPFCTSGETGLSGIVNSGFATLLPSIIYGVIKAYSTKVGNGAFPTEMNEEESIRIRELGKEYGSTTGRSRKIGYLDLPMTKYSIEKGGITNLIVAKLDILDGMDKIPVCHRYDKPPMTGSDFAIAKPKYLEVNGWKDSKDFAQTKEFIHTIEYWTETKVSYVSCGVNKEDFFKVN